MISEQELFRHFTGSRENLTDEAMRDITAVIGIFYKDLYDVEYESNEEAERLITEGTLAIKAVADSWAWTAPEESGTDWTTALLEGTLDLVAPFAKEAIKLGLQAGIQALKGGIA